MGETSLDRREHSDLSGCTGDGGCGGGGGGGVMMKVVVVVVMWVVKER